MKFRSASQNRTKSHYLVELGKVNLVTIISCADLLTVADNRPSLEWPKIDLNTKAIALVFCDFGMHIGIERNHTF